MNGAEPPRILPDSIIELQVRLERLEAIVMLLCQEARRGKSEYFAQPFDDFIDGWDREHRGDPDRV